jgi:hypothetical protein
MVDPDDQKTQPEPIERPLVTSIVHKYQNSNNTTEYRKHRKVDLKDLVNERLAEKPDADPYSVMREVLSEVRAAEEVNREKYAEQERARRGEGPPQQQIRK